MSETIQVIESASTEELRHNVRAALARGLPEVQQQIAQLMPLTLLGNGPSAARAKFQAPVMALNGALGLFIREGGFPTFWACCDPGPVVATFLRGAPTGTHYFVASRCHPSVIDALAGRQVFLWHLDEAVSRDLLIGRTLVPTAASITLCAFGLARLMGFRRLETWGWDGCYGPAGSHAMPQDHVGERRRANLDTPDGQGFDTNDTWVFEAREAMIVLRDNPVKLKIHGNGMFGAILRRHALAEAA
jgi:hypothetical protein